MKEGVERLAIDEEEIPFTSEEKYMQTRHADRSFLKGASEKIIALCNDVDTKTVLARNVAMAQQGLRVLGCAVKEKGRTRFVGLLGMEDPPRAGVADAIKKAKQAGIRTIMITGDHLETARSVAKRVGIEGEALEGKDLDRLSPEELSKAVPTVSIFARVSPLHKVAVLRALERNGEIVAMSGDGVNDAPALKGAHVGVAMGKKGTEVAREAASMILADDHYATIVAAVEEGRRIYDNIRKFVLFLLRSNFDEILFIVTALLLGLPLPYLPLHILWINLMTDSLPALALGIEPAEPDLMQRPPRPPTESLLAGQVWKLLLAVLWGFAVSLGL
jgi:P-type Ca2+ transporter type 2C